MPLVILVQTLLLLLKPAAQVLYSTSTCWCWDNSGKQPTVNCTLEPIQRFGVEHSEGKVIPHSNLSRQERPSKLGSYTPRYFKLQWVSCGRSSGMSNSSRSRWKLAEQTVIVVLINRVQHTKPSHTTSMTQRQETYQGKVWPPNTPGAQDWRWHSPADPHTGEKYSIRIGRTNAKS